MKSLFRNFFVATVALATIGSAQSGPAKAAPNPRYVCEDKEIVQVGEFVPITVVSTDNGQPLSWDTRGSQLTLQKGKPPSVRILPDENYGWVLGSCLVSPILVRLSRDKTDPPSVDSYLVSSPETTGVLNVLIGAFGPGNIYGRFYLEKVSGSATNSPGPEFHFGDEFVIRGVRRDWWLVVPPGAVEGSKITLSQIQAEATHFTFSHH